MPLREWGLGLELLTEYYLKYIENCIVERGRVVPILMRITGRKYHVEVPYEIDLLAVRQKFKELELVQCTENLTLPKAEDVFARLRRLEKQCKEVFQLKFTDVRISYAVSYTNASKDAKEFLQQKEVILRSSHDMIEGLRTFISMVFEAENRKGYLREPMLWLMYQIFNKK